MINNPSMRSSDMESSDIELHEEEDEEVDNDEDNEEDNEDDENNDKSQLRFLCDMLHARGPSFPSPPSIGHAFSRTQEKSRRTLRESYAKSSWSPH